MIAPDEFPWDVGLTFQDGAPTRYDSGDYQAGLQLRSRHIGYESFPEMQARMSESGTVHRPRHGVIRGGNWNRTVRGRARARGWHRPEGGGGNLRRHPGTGAPDELCPDRGR